MTLNIIAIDSAVRYAYAWCRGRRTSVGAILAFAVGTRMESIHYVCHGCTKRHMRSKRIEAEVAVALLSKQRSACIFDGMPSSFYNEFEPPICDYDIFVVKAPIRGCAQIGAYSICYDGEVTERGIKIEDVVVPYRLITTLNELAHNVANDYMIGLWQMATSGCVLPTGVHPAMFENDLSIY